MFTREELIERMDVVRTANGFEIAIPKSAATWMPFFMPSSSGEYIRAAAKMLTIEKGTDRYTTTIAYDGQKWYVGCGNQFLEGSITQGEADIIVASLAESSLEEEEMRMLYNIYDRRAACDHWREWYSQGELCKHGVDALARFNVQDIKDIEKHYYGGNRQNNHLSTEEMVAARMEVYEFGRHLCFIGEKGAGKTFHIYEYLKHKGYDHVYVGGNANIESIDLLGKLLPYENNGEKNFIWVDGPMTQAFRRAANGEKIVLFIDEILRISPSGQSLMVPAFAEDIYGNYVLDTGRVINVEGGVGQTEVLRAPKENLWVLATTNIGAGYDIGDMESAFEDRFEFIEMNNDPEKIKRTLLKIEKSKGFSGVVEKLMNFYEKMQELKENGMVSKLINLRHLSQALQDTKTEDDLYDRLMDRAPKWVERDMGGKMIEDQVDAIKNALSHVGV